MRQKYIHLVALLLASPVLAWAQNTSPAQLEIRTYRFSHHKVQGFDRLVLEFADMGAQMGTPRVSATRTAGSKEVSVQVDNALLLGAIPESLINDAYSRKAHYLGPVTVSMENPDAGFSLRFALKKGASRVEASWLNNPPRLVIDARGQSLAHVERTAMSLGADSRHPPLSELVCFPSTTKVGLNVIFKPKNQGPVNDLQNIRVNTDGLTPVQGTPGPDAISCYPKQSIVVAALSFESGTASTLLSTPSHSEQFYAPPAAAPAAQDRFTESDLDPGPLTMPSGIGQLPLSKGARKPADTADTANAAPNPLMLLPPLNN